MVSSSATASRADRLQAFLRSPDIPAPFYTNTTTDDNLITVTTQFDILYHKYFPDRKPLFLLPNNECQRPKMICSFVRPTLLPYDELFDLEGTCQFVADYVRYEPLYDPSIYDDEYDDTVEQLPQQIVSPATALDWQVGNCFEISLVLVSILIGAGFNAYVVVGSATKAVCLSDQKSTMWEGALPTEANSDDEVEDDMPQNNPYVALIPEKLTLRLTTDPDPVSVSKKDSVMASGGDYPKDTETPNVRGGAVKPIHSWVLVLPGGRQSVSKAVFVEPSTGQLIPFSATDSRYTSVEALFNHQDYHVNMRPEAPVSFLSPDLADQSQWESLFSCTNPSDEEVESLVGTSSTTRRAFTNELVATTTATTVATTEVFDSSRSRRMYIPNLWSSELILNRQQYESRYPGGYKETTYVNAVVRRYAPYSQSDYRILEVVVPDAEYAELHETHVFYAHRADKLRRTTVFPSSAPQSSSKESFILSGLSSVSLEKASEGPRKVIEWYQKGRIHNTSVEGLRELIYEPGKQRTMKFYWRARSDGLYCRTELLYDVSTLRKVKEFYKGRSDRLWYRSFSYGFPSTMRERDMHSLIVQGPGNVSALHVYPRLDPVRISQKFLRNESVPARKDVAKMTFRRPASEGKSGGNNGAPTVGEIWVFFHYDAGSILRPYHMFAKPSSSVEEYIAASAAGKPAEPPMRVVSLPGEEPPSELDLYNERKWLNAVEVACLMEQRAKSDECMDILKSIEQGHSKPQHVLSVYDTLRNRPKETEAERAKKLAEAARREESRKDYLAPYIAKLEMPADFDGNYLSVPLSMEQARQVRDEALQELKDRLIQRGHIMQSRMDKEKVEFSKRQQLYRKNCDASALEGDKETEAFALYCKEATWRMKVLDERLLQHIDHASEKYNQLAQRLAEDPRLSALYHPGH
ncbi:conserved hypothetical protein [Leishmania mexicana MHOM/GT/2001/U1103]|uniref:Coiled-coil domain-containing protein 135 n=1 Tax=Leishmania mexicana (strain MHOM/GT/2001/U1103) TaxID=929439 RepID=E9AKK8_LEIMU|nr:conserved hypothetical protein [Leishmania mexicana MHOM/GT/2001/U1103]CBZ23459.1 conserved hypothetical protein [Leishmania mexicana MHOM/GT/2001/U1103]